MVMVVRASVFLFFPCSGSGVYGMLSFRVLGFGVWGSGSGSRVLCLLF